MNTPTSISRRLGRFRISEDMVTIQPEAVMKVLAECLVIRCESMFETRTLDYVALSPHFEEIPDFCRALEYEAQLETVNVGTQDNPVWEPRFKEFRRVNNPV